MRRRCARMQRRLANCFFILFLFFFSKALRKLESEHKTALDNLKEEHAEALRTHAEALRKLDVEKQSALDTLKSAHAEVICIIYLVLHVMRV